MSDESWEVKRRRLAERYGTPLDEEHIVSQVDADAWEPSADWGQSGGMTSRVQRVYQKFPWLVPPKKSKEIKKQSFRLGEISPGTDGAEFLVKLVGQIENLLIEQTALDERIRAFESKADPCYQERGAGWRSVDGECLKLDVSDEGQNIDRSTQSYKSSEARPFTKSVKYCGNAACKANGKPHIHEQMGS